MNCTNYAQNIDVNEKQFNVYSGKLSIYIFEKVYEISGSEEIWIRTRFFSVHLQYVDTRLIPTPHVSYNFTVTNDQQINGSDVESNLVDSILYDIRSGFPHKKSFDKVPIAWLRVCELYGFVTREIERNRRALI